MSIAFITIDFWQTLYDSSNGPARNAQRKDALVQAITSEHGTPDMETFDAAYAGLWEYFDQHWLGTQRTPTSKEMVGEILRQLTVPLSNQRVVEVVRIFEEGILFHPPSLLPGVREGLEYLAAIGPLALISDTAFSPGSVLRQLMERDGIARYFNAFVFSDETGVAKPHPDAFRHALSGIGGKPEQAVHIGDIERTDIHGAKDAGMRAVLYRSSEHLHKYAQDETVADAVMGEWNQIADVLKSLA